MQFFIYINELGIPTVFRQLDDAKAWAEGDRCVDESEAPQWKQTEDVLKLYVKGRSAPVAELWERYVYA